MTREDPKLLPICQVCGEYKGVGNCQNPACSGFKLGMKDEQPIGRKSEKQSCSVCKRKSIVSCIQCGRSFCKKHSKGDRLHQLGSFHQILGTCVECNEVVCENCWILNPNGDIICLAHLEDKQETRGIR